MIDVADYKPPLVAGVNQGDLYVIYADARVGFIYECPLGVTRVFELLEALKLPRETAVLDLWTSICPCGETIH
jgi:hypothetical protein